MIVAGGFDTLYLHDVVLLDFGTDSNEWLDVKEIGSVPFGIEAHTSVSVGDRIIVFGGEDSNQPLASLYDIHVSLDNSIM